MTITRDQALQQLQAWTKNPSLLGHARSVEIVMRAAAPKYGSDPDVWAITGLGHDAEVDDGQGAAGLRRTDGLCHCLLPCSPRRHRHAGTQEREEEAEGQ